MRISSELKRFNDYHEEDHKDMYRKEIAALASDFGRDLAERGVMACIRDTKREGARFRPMPEDFKEYVLLEKAAGLRKWGAPKDDCNTCQGMGWRPVADDRVTKCECRRLA